MRLLAIAFLSLAAPACALTTQEVIDLVEAGVSDEIIINQMKADGSAFELTARDIVDLQKKKVSPTVLNFMVQARGKAAPTPPAGETAPIPRADPPKAEARDAVLTVRNLAKGKVTVLVYPHEREIALVKGEIVNGTVLANGSRSDIPLPGGIYTVRWASDEPFRELAVAAGVTTEFEFRDDDRAFRGLRVVLFLDGQEEPDPNAPRITAEPQPEETPQPRIYRSPTNSNVTIIRDIQQVPTRVVIVPGTSSYARTYYPYDSYAGDCGSPSYVVEPVYRPRVTFGFSYGGYYGHRSYSRDYYHGGHSWGGGGHHYSRTLDNVQYYLRWPFGHRHR